MKITSIDGWVLDTITAYDSAYPGFAGGYLRASDERRQVIAAFLAVTQVDLEERGEAAVFLATADHQTILALAFGRRVAGLRRALAKSGAKPHDAEYYRALADAFVRSPAHVVTALKRAVKLSPKWLEIITALPMDLCDSRIICRIEGREQASDLARVVDHMEHAGIDRSKLVAALLESKAPLTTVVQRWSLRMPFGPGPISMTASYRPIHNGQELRSIALRYQNCSRRYLIDVLAGESAFGEFTALDGRQVLVCFNRQDGEWCLDAAYARRNRQVSDDLNCAVREFVQGHGVLAQRPSRERDENISALRRFNRSVFTWW